MSDAVTIQLEQAPSHAVARVRGPATADDFAAAIRQLARFTRTHGHKRALADCLQVTLKLGFSDHYAIGRHIAAELAHLDRMVTVLPEPMITRASEKVAAGAGLQLRVLSDMQEALAFLLDDAPPPAAG